MYVTKEGSFITLLSILVNESVELEGLAQT